MLELEAAGLARVSESGLEIAPRSRGCASSRSTTIRGSATMVGGDKKFAAHNAAA